MRDGQGTSTSPNGDKYDGEWRDDMRNGQGTATLHDGTRYVGEWLNDKRHGSGASIFPNGEKYVGEYRDDKRNGPGIVYGPNGTVRLSGLWADGGLVQSYAIDPIRRPFKDSASTGNSSRAEQDQLAVVRDAAHQRRPTVQDQANAASSPPSTSFERVTPTIEANLPANSNVSAPNLRRVALVIGNARYNNAPVLTNPPADAASVSAALREAGFQTVTVKTDLSQQATLTALREFAALADAADWAVVYYAGHGIEFGGNNYLVPVDARLQADRDIDLEGVDLGKVMAAVEGAKRLRLIILDACRDNPFASQMRRTMASRSLGRGLAKVEPEPGTLIAYAAKHGETAIDGVATRNSPFAEALVKRIRQTPPIEVRRLFDYVRDDVLKATNKKQQPFSYGSVSADEDFYFVSPK
jgi:hypothetical protein